jgi:methylmalonyl-CoA mutase
MVFSKQLNLFQNVPVITKAGIDDSSVYPSVKEQDENNIFLNLLLNQFDKVKMDLDPYWEVILTWDEK